MARPRTRGLTERRPMWEDLTDVQRDIAEALPAELRQFFIDELPPIQLCPMAAKKKVDAIKRHLPKIDTLVRTLAAHKRELERVAGELENGRGAGPVDLRKLLAPPEIEGVSLRFMRQAS